MDVPGRGGHDGAAAGQDRRMRYVELRRHTLTVLGLVGRVVPPLGKGKGVLLIEDGGHYRVEPLD